MTCNAWKCEQEAKEGGKLCRACAQAAVDRGARKRAERREAGLCAQCDTLSERFLCPRHRTIYNEALQRRRAAKRARRAARAA